MLGLRGLVGRLKAVFLLSHPGEQCEMLFSSWPVSAVRASSQYAHSMLERTCRAEKRKTDESRKRQALEHQEPAVNAASPMRAEGKQAGANVGARGDGAGDQPPKIAKEKARI